MWRAGLINIPSFLKHLEVTKYITTCSVLKLEIQLFAKMKARLLGMLLLIAADISTAATASPRLSLSSYVLSPSIVESRTSAYQNLYAAPSKDLQDSYDTTESEYLRPADWTCLINKQCSDQLPNTTTSIPLKIEARGVIGYDKGDIYAASSKGRIRFSMRIFAGTIEELEKGALIERLKGTDKNDYTSTSIRYEDEYGYMVPAEGMHNITDHQDHLIEGMILSKDPDLKRYAKNYVYQLPYKLPCWVRWVYIKIFGIKLRFPRFGWGRRCCGKITGGGSYFSNATGCYEGTGPFYSQAQCERVCGPFSVSPPPPPDVNSNCTFGDGTSWAHGHTETNCAGTSCTCNNGTVTCSGCRNRYEIHDVHNVTVNPRPGGGLDGTPTHTKFEEAVVKSLIWVSKGCSIDGVDTCAGWMDGALQNHLTYGGVAHGNSRFFPWHRAYLKTLEEKMQNYHPCVTMPYWDWTQDQVKPNGDFQWTEKMAGTAPAGTPTGQQGLWGNINGDANTLMGAFTTTEWIIPGSFPVHRRTTSMNPSSSLPSTATITSYLARTSFGTSPSLKAFESPHGSPHVMIGGNMGNGRSPADPIFWLHHAGVDKLWWDWQLLHTPTDYDADPTLVMPPFTRAPQDVFDSQNDLGVCYAPVGSPVPDTFEALTTSSSSRRLLSATSGKHKSSRRLLSTKPADYGGLVASVNANLPKLTQEMEASSKNETCQAINAAQCGDTTACYNCLTDTDGSKTSITSECADSWATNMMLDPEEVAREACIVKAFNDKNPAEMRTVNVTYPCPASANTCPSGTGTTWSTTTCSCVLDTRKELQLALLNEMTPQQCNEHKSIWRSSSCQQTCSSRL